MNSKAWLVVSALLLAGCGNSSETKTDVSSSNFDHFKIGEAEFAKAKMIPEGARERRQSAFESFQSRTTITRYLLASGLYNDPKGRLEAQEMLNNLVLSRYLDQVGESQITPERVEAFYTANKDQFASHEFDVAHVLIRVPPNASEQEVSKLEAKADKAYQAIQQGTDFSSVVSEFSDDVVTKGDSGRLAGLQSQNLQPSLKQLFIDMQPGDVSLPIRTERGFQIFQLTAAKAIPKPLDEVRSAVEHEVKKAIKQKEMERLRVLAEADSAGSSAAR